RGAVTTIPWPCGDLWTRRLESMVAGNSGLEPAVSSVRCGRDGARPADIDRAPPAADDPQAVYGRTIHRPCAEECLATGWIRPCRLPLGASRSEHLLTPQTRQRSNGSTDQVKISTGENIYEFQSVSA